MKQKILVLPFILCITACSEKVFPEQIEREKFREYFTIRTGSSIVEGKHRYFVSPQINKLPQDKVSDYINRHSLRFDYIIHKHFFAVYNREFNSILNKENTLDTSRLSNLFQLALATDTFYHHFTLLISSSSTGIRGDIVQYTVPEMMKVASRFFHSEMRSTKDTSLTYYICVLRNGISTLRSEKDYTALEAFCFEAIFKTSNTKPKYMKQLNHEFKRLREEGRSKFKDVNSYLLFVREHCYEVMESNLALQQELLKYYESNKGNVNFKII